MFRPFILFILFSLLPLISFSQDSTAVEYHPSVWADAGLGKVGEQLGVQVSLTSVYHQKAI